ncbi:MAG: TRAP transporter substrate-binding protein [Woeseiaceae bacterium]|nr:TRAP transporter substrate-binding protein [Woeseiaceae bacterium]
MAIKRRQFVGGLAMAAGAAACAGGDDAPESARSGERFEWNMVTSWPPGLPGLGVGVENFVRRIETASAGRLRIKIFAGGELVPALECFDAVRSGTAQMGHDASYYHRGKVPATQFFTAKPFGLTAPEMDAWLYYGGGLELWQELYEPLGMTVFPAGNTTCQTLGWFNKELSSVADIRGLKVRMPGLGGEVMQRAGATQVTMPASEIFTSLQTGAIDAAEWVGPYNDIALGLHKAARYYYYPGFHEPGPAEQCMINLDAWNSLPEDLQEIVRVSCQSVNLDIQAEYNWGNARALQQLQEDPNVEVREVPDEIFAALRDYAEEAAAESAARDEFSARVQASIDAFMALSTENLKVGEYTYLRKRIETAS